MSRVIKTEVVRLPLMTSSGLPRRGPDGKVIEPREDELHECVVVTVAPEPLTAGEAEAVRRRMMARAARSLA